MELLLGGSLGGILILFLLVLAVLWFLLPFAIFGTKDILKDIQRESEKTNDLLSELISKLDTEKQVKCCNELSHTDSVKRENNKESEDQLIYSLKKNKDKVGFSKDVKICELCHSSETGQLIDNHYICSACRGKYLE